MRPASNFSVNFCDPALHAFTRLDWTSAACRAKAVARGSVGSARASKPRNVRRSEPRVHRGNAGGCAGARGKTLRRSDISPSTCASPQSSGCHGRIESRLRGASAREFNSSTTRPMAGDVGAGAEAPLPLLGPSHSTLTTSEMHLRPGFSNSCMTGCNAIKLRPSASRHLQASAPPNYARGNARILSKSPWSSQEKKKGYVDEMN